VLALRFSCCPVGELQLVQPALVASLPWKLQVRRSQANMQASTIAPSPARDMDIAAAPVSLACI
jgi:hypothetical protein